MRWIIGILAVMAFGHADGRWLQPYFVPETPVPNDPVVLVITTLCEHGISPVHPVEISRVGNRTEITVVGYSVSPICSYARYDTRIDIPPMDSGEHQIVVYAKWPLPPTQNFEVEVIARIVLNVGGISNPIPVFGNSGVLVLLLIVLALGIKGIRAPQRVVP